MTIHRRTFLMASAFSLATWITSLGSAQPTAGALTPEQFGAKGDGVANDTDAFARMAAQLNLNGGGRIVLRRTTYLVGRQLRPIRRDAQYAFEPAAIMELIGCSGPVTIVGNGARLRCAPGLRYGTFNPISGAKTANPMPYYGRGQLASPYRCMILVEGCSGPVEISDLELDGGVAGLIVGGEYGDVGRQIPATGVGLYNNSGGETLRRIRSHHHALDGVIIDGVDRLRAGGAMTLMEDIRCEANGRQGCSIVGGRNIEARRSRFSGTGKAGLFSPPGAGVDIEAEGGKKVRDLCFVDCTFADNTGCGLLADSGDSAGARFTNCTLVGTTSWSAWPKKPDFSFSGCTFVGPIVNCHGDRAQPQRSTRFVNCRFVDDPALSPTSAIYGGANPSRPIADLSDARNVLFDTCDFRLTHDSVLPWSTGAIYKDCRMSQRSSRQGYPRGYYVGRNSISGNVDLYGSKVNGELIKNGARLTGEERWNAG